MNRDRLGEISDFADALADNGRRLSGVQVAQVQRLLAGRQPAASYVSLRDAGPENATAGTAVLAADDLVWRLTFAADGTVEAVVDRLPLRRVVVRLPDEQSKGDARMLASLPDDDFPRGTRLTLVFADSGEMNLPPDGAREEYAQRTALGDLYRHLIGVGTSG